MNRIVDAWQAGIGVTRLSDWVIVDQAMIDLFADVTGDRQFIHVDPVAAAETPFGGTVVHGFLTLSLLPRLFEWAAQAPAPGLLVNYGFDRVRFVQPVRAGSRVRGAFTLVSSQQKRPGRIQQSHEVSVMIEGQEEPALIALWLTQVFI